jgi:hypothetical protein
MEARGQGDFGLGLYSGVPYSVYVHHSLIDSLHKYKEELIRITSTAFNQDIRFSRNYNFNYFAHLQI